jgi:hypothetical protein
MAKKSTTDLTLVRPATPGEQLPAPDDLIAAEAALWRRVVDSKPASWFSADCAPLLAEYCRAAVVCDRLAQRIQTALRAADPRGLKRLLDARHQEAVRLATLGTKLRLTPQSKYTAKSAATAERRVAGPRPWGGKHDA